MIIRRWQILCISFVLIWGVSKAQSNYHRTEAEVIVIGGGLMGSATAWHLSSQGQDVIVLEKQNPEYTTGSSKGTARIARSNNRASDIWSYLHNRSVEETEKLIDFLNGRKKVKTAVRQDRSVTAVVRPKKTHFMKDIYTTSPVSYIGSLKIYDQLLESLHRQHVDYKMSIDRDEAMKMFGVELPPDNLIQREYNKHSGTLNPKVLIEYLHEAVDKLGNQVYYGYEVERVERVDTTYRVHVKRTGSDKPVVMKCNKIVFAAGPYNPILLQEVAPYIKDMIVPERVFLSFFKIDPLVYRKLNYNSKRKLSNGYPVINSAAGTRLGSYFSMFEYIDTDKVPVIKIGGHFQRTSISNVDDVWNQPLDQSEIEWGRTNTLSYLKLLHVDIPEDALEYVGGYSCVYSLTKNEIPLVSYLLKEDGTHDSKAVIIGGMSGVGAKGTMAYGLIASHILLGKNEQHPLYKRVRDVLCLDYPAREFTQKK